MQLKDGWTLEEVARIILYQHDYHEKHGDWDHVSLAPSVDNGQGFAGWACDMLETALESEGKEPYDFDAEAAKAHHEID